MTIQRELEPISNRLDDPPIVVLGYTAPELAWAAAACTLVPASAGAIVGAVVGQVLACMAVGLILGGAAFFVIGKWLAGVKEGKPNNYHSHKMALMARHMLGSKFVHREGIFDIGRS